MDEIEAQDTHAPHTPPTKTPQTGVNQHLGIALGGGLARGFAHIGVLKALLKADIHPSIVAGTSIGAVVGGCFLANKLEALEEWALSLNRKRVLSYLDFRVRTTSLIGGKRLTKLLHSHLGTITIEDLNAPLAIIATNLLTGHEVWLQTGSLVEAMNASFALPGIFPPVEHGNRLLIDGALVNPVPIGPCQAMGAQMTIAVSLHGGIMGRAHKDGKNYPTVAGFDLFDEGDVQKQEQGKFNSGINRRVFKRKDQKTPSLFGVTMSAVNIMQDRLTRLRLASAPPDIIIKPKISHIGIAEFDRAEELIKAGSDAAEEALPQIREVASLLFHTYA